MPYPGIPANRTPAGRPSSTPIQPKPVRSGATRRRPVSETRPPSPCPTGPRRRGRLPGNAGSIRLSPTPGWPRHRIPPIERPPGQLQPHSQPPGGGHPASVPRREIGRKRPAPSAPPAPVGCHQGQALSFPEAGFREGHGESPEARVQGKARFPVGLAPPIPSSQPPHPHPLGQDPGGNVAVLAVGLSAVTYCRRWPGRTRRRTAGWPRASGARNRRLPSCWRWPPPCL